MPSKRLAIVYLFSFILFGGLSRAAEPSSLVDEPDPESSICGFLREPLAFWLFRNAAGKTDARRVTGIRDIERISFNTRDGRRLGGYKLPAQGNSIGYLLVAQGNAMLADQIMNELTLFRDRGFDVYVYDYRGYGLSGGKSRLAAIISDYREIIVRLNSQPYLRQALYGLSMGGIILLNAVGTVGNYSALVIDSSPSRISHLGCPESVDPVNHLPNNGSRLKIISGERDRVVRPAEMEELMLAAEKRGAQIVRRPDYAHPFQDTTHDIQQRRLNEAADFLAR